MEEYKKAQELIKSELEEFQKNSTREVEQAVANVLEKVVKILQEEAKDVYTTRQEEVKKMKKQLLMIAYKLSLGWKPLDATSMIRLSKQLYHTIQKEENEQVRRSRTLAKDLSQDAGKSERENRMLVDFV